VTAPIVSVSAHAAVAVVIVVPRDGRAAGETLGDQLQPQHVEPRRAAGRLRIDLSVARGIAVVHQIPRTPAVVDDADAALLDQVVLEVPSAALGINYDIGGSARSDRVAVIVVGVARREAVVGVVIEQPCRNRR